MASNISGSANPSYKHGHAVRSGYTPEYNSWCNMRRRCYSESNNRFEFYGKLGITVCDEWNPLAGGSFEQFLSDMGNCPDGHSLERKDLKGNYCKENCKWATDIEQANNKTNNRLIQREDGVVWSLRRWCVMLGLDYKSCWYYIFKVGNSPASVLGGKYNHYLGASND